MQKSGTDNRKGFIFNIQRFSIHDGPGIRSTVFLKGCPLNCFWCQNPESQGKEPEIFLNRNPCTLCGECIAVCPTDANALLDQSLVFDRSKCKGCGKCVEVCPSGARNLVGRYITVDDIIQEVIRDKNFYKNSGGGVTFSGGDPLFQPEFALSILKECKKAGLHTALDTCGFAPWSIIKELLHYSDIVLYDIKCIDGAKHYKATGKLNTIILENARKIAKDTQMRIRVPIVPGFNDTKKEILAIVKFVKELGDIAIDLLPYNNMAESKYERLDGTPIKLQDKGEAHLRELESIVCSK